MPPRVRPIVSADVSAYTATISANIAIDLRLSPPKQKVLGNFAALDQLAVLLGAPRQHEDLAVVKYRRPFAILNAPQHELQVRPGQHRKEDRVEAMRLER